MSTELSRLSTAYFISLIRYISDMNFLAGIQPILLINPALPTNEKSLSKYPVLISEAINVMRSKEHFYNPKLLTDAISIIEKCLEIASLKYAPSKLSLSSFYNQNLQYNYDSISYFVNDKTTNNVLIRCFGKEYLILTIV